VHVSGADGTDFARTPAEGNKGGSSIWCRSDSNETLFGRRMDRVRGNAGFRAEERFNLGSGETVLFAFRGVSVVPVELHEMYVRMCGQSRDMCLNVHWKTLRIR
jgi:hypothetical protein